MAVCWERGKEGVHLFYFGGKGEKGMGIKGRERERKREGRTRKMRESNECEHVNGNEYGEIRYMERRHRVRLLTDVGMRNENPLRNNE